MTIFYNQTKNLTKRVLLRKSQTKEETLLWAKVRNSQLGFKIKRQYSVGPYLLDFYCASKKLAIEIDGAQHREEKEYDKLRSDYLAVFGIRVIRFWNSEINKDIEEVILKIKTAFKTPLLIKERGRGEVNR
ncbi:MAG: DUF559 domain-containing protein [Candidatus Paceibacterota bacterium]